MEIIDDWIKTSACLHLLTMKYQGCHRKQRSGRPLAL